MCPAPFFYTEGYPRVKIYGVTNVTEESDYHDICHAIYDK